MALTVHPHQRGDNGFGATEEAAIIAVHPHQRGDNEPEPEPTPDKERFTPTSVGTTGIDLTQARYAIGSPPPAWGQRPRPTQLPLG